MPDENTKPDEGISKSEEERIADAVEERIRIINYQESKSDARTTWILAAIVFVIWLIIKLH